MGCYFVRGFDGERVLIPGCMMSLHLDYCWCEHEGIKSNIATHDELERKVEELEGRILRLERPTEGEG